MTFAKVGDVMVPEILMEHIPGAFAGMQVMAGTGAAVISTTMPHGKAQLGEEVKIPYFDTIGEMDDIATDGDALTPRGISDSNETAAIRHSGIAIEATHWARLSGNADPYAEMARQMAEAAKRRIDKALIDVAVSASGTVLTNDVWATSPVNMTYNVFIDSLGKFEDEADNFAALVVRSEVYATLLKMVDGNDRPLLTTPVDGGLTRILGVPIIQSNRLPRDNTNVSHPKYTSLLLKKASLAAWVNGSPVVKSDEDILADTEVSALHMYWAAHRYGRLPGGTLPGVCRIIHNAE